MSEFCKCCGKPVSKGMQLCGSCEKRIFGENLRRFERISRKRNKILLSVGFTSIVLALVLIVASVMLLDTANSYHGIILALLGAVSAFISTVALSVVGVEIFYK